MLVVFETRSLLKVQVLDALCLTCKKLRDAAWHDPLWKYLYDKDFGGTKLEWQSWRKVETYFRVYLLIERHTKKLLWNFHTIRT